MFVLALTDPTTTRNADALCFNTNIKPNFPSLGPSPLHKHAITPVGVLLNYLLTVFSVFLNVFTLCTELHIIKLYWGVRDRSICQTHTHADPILRTGGDN